jgi:AcrR family transcriptional regulator
MKIADGPACEGPQGKPEADASLSRRGQQRPRRSRVAAGDARNAILEAAAELFCSETCDSVGLDRVAAQAGLHKMNIYRSFGSRERLVQACVSQLCERERIQWDELLSRFPGSPHEQLRQLFIDLSNRLLAGDCHDYRMHRLARHFPNAAHPVRVTIAEYKDAFHGLLRNLSLASEVVDAAGLADTLMLLWDGATMNLRAPGDAQRVARRLPGLINEILRTYGAAR